MSWPGVIRFLADFHAAVSDGLYLAADLLEPDVSTVERGAS